MSYRSMIETEAAHQGRVDVDPRHVEAYMRLEHSTLDGLSHGQFKREVAIGINCIDADGLVNAESCARSFAL